MRVVSAWLLTALAGCSSGDVIAELPAEDDTGQGVIDTMETDGPDTAAPADAATDASGADVAETTPTDALSDTSAPPADTGSADIGTTFPCGSETCGSSLQFCRRATSPGICPAPDAGIVCPAGCPGCMPLSLKCENLPMKCWAKPSCSCILIEVCGSAAAGDCMEKDGGFVAGCRGV